MPFRIRVVTVLAIVMPSVALMVSAGITAYFGSRVHKEVKTSNGLTLAALADRAEGRRIAADIPAEDQSASEKHYVEQLARPDTQ